MRLFLSLVNQVIASLFLSLLLLLASCSNDSEVDLSAIPGCDPGEVVETDGHRRLALIVGVGEYKKFRIRDLEGPPNDARRFYELLTGKNGYGFPKQNVCMLLDEQATTKAVKAAFEQTLVERARKDDVAVFFFAGHGSQAPDKNGDEPDGIDESVLLHDARTGGVQDLVDDEFNEMLGRLHRKTNHITVIGDSCHASGTWRAPEASTSVSRFFPPATEDEQKEAEKTTLTGDGAAGWTPETLPGLVVFSAAADGKPALERGGRGVFTDALLQTLSQVSTPPLTYAQVARQTPHLIEAESKQVPYFHGDLHKPVFGNTHRKHPVSWEVREVEPALELTGPPLPGIGPGAEFRIFDGAVTGADTRDPSQSKGIVVVKEMLGLNANAHVKTTTPGAAPVQPGDLAVMLRPADAFVILKVRLRPAEEAGGIPAERAATLRQLVDNNQEARVLIELTEGKGDFELSVDSNNHLLLRGPQHLIRNIYDSDDLVPRNLWQHARQRALLQLRGEGGSDFVDNETLQVRLVPAAEQSDCATGKWEVAKPNAEQVIPLCHEWHVEVVLSKSSPMPLLIGALLLDSDGSIFALPADDQRIRLQPGEKYTFKAQDEIFVSSPPLGVRDHVIVIGTQETNPMSFSLFAEEAESRRQRGMLSDLFRAIHRYLQPGARLNAEPDEGLGQDTTWTLSSMAMRVEANQRFIEGHEGQPIRWREYTIRKFDVRPYLPDATDAALYKVLQKADRLARASVNDGFSYKQHPWNKPSDAQNLALGIDCSRAIWYAFTRAGLPYNRDDRYLTTAMMVTENTLMKDQFESCRSDPNVQLGDVLVYRDDTRGDGHVVMVIDPEKRIAWGSHGWDGNPRVLPVAPDTGVEYQKIKFKKDLERWDRKTMTLKACWRYRRFIEERHTGRGLPGLQALATVCEPDRRCGRL